MLTLAINQPRRRGRPDNRQDHRPPSRPRTIIYQHNTTEAQNVRLNSRTRGIVHESSRERHSFGRRNSFMTSDRRLALCMELDSGRASAKVIGPPISPAEAGLSPRDSTPNRRERKAITVPSE